MCISLHTKALQFSEKNRKKRKRKAFIKFPPYLAENSFNYTFDFAKITHPCACCYLTSCLCLCESGDFGFLCCSSRCPQAVRMPTFYPTWAACSWAHSQLRGPCSPHLVLCHCAGDTQWGKGFLRHPPQSSRIPHLRQRQRETKSRYL